MNPNVMLVVLLFGLAVYFLEPKVPDPFLFPTSSIADLVTDIQPAVVEIQVAHLLHILRLVLDLPSSLHIHAIASYPSFSRVIVLVPALLPAPVLILPDAPLPASLQVLLHGRRLWGGSGFLIHPSGSILTNAHVVQLLPEDECRCCSEAPQVRVSHSPSFLPSFLPYIEFNK